MVPSVNKQRATIPWPETKRIIGYLATSFFLSGYILLISHKTIALIQDWTNEAN